MKIKKYEVSDMKEALRMIKEDLGSDAVILSTRKVMKSNNFGLFARPVLEVTAAVEYDGEPLSRGAVKQPKTQNVVKQQKPVDVPKPAITSGYGYGAYPSGYAVTPKPQASKQSKSKPGSVIRSQTTKSSTGYNKFTFDELITDDYLAEAMADAGIKDNDEELYAPPAVLREDDNDDVVPAYIPRDKKTVSNVKPVTEKKESVSNSEGKSQAELNAERMAAVIKAVGLDKFTNLLDDIGDIKKQLANMQNNMSSSMVIDLPARLKDYHSLFLKNGVDDIISYRLLKVIEKEIADKEMTAAQIKGAAVDKLASLLPLELGYSDIINGRITAFAGPTGVGKTTTIAKIAASMALKYGKKVCLITVDNFRIGAVEQLKTYAEIVNLPLYVATSPDELKRVIAKVKNKYDSILIDSMGRGQYDTAQIEGIKEFFSVDPQIVTVLVLSMASNHNELYDTYDRYEVLKPDYLIFTKLDETKYFGPLINLPVKKKIPLLLVTTGQNVPDDMEIPDGRKIARRMLQEIPTQWSDK